MKSKFIFVALDATLVSISNISYVSGRTQWRLLHFEIYLCKEDFTNEFYSTYVNIQIYCFSLCQVSEMEFFNKSEI